MEVFGLGLKIQEQGAATVEASLKRLGTQIGKTVLAVATLTAGLKKLVKETSEAQYAAAALDNAMASVGSTVGTTSEALKAQASALQSVSTFGDDAIIRMQTLLLMFTNIRGEILTRSIPAIVDMATFLQTDLSSAAMMLGKALQDPANGLMALNRSTKLFMEEEKKMIEQLAKSGKMLEAQEMILRRVDERFGGAAAKARKTLGGALEGLSLAWGDLFEISQESSQGIVDAINDIAAALPKIRDAANTGFNKLYLWLGETWKRFFQLNAALAEFNIQWARASQKLSGGLIGKEMEKEQQARLDKMLEMIDGFNKIIDAKNLALLGGEPTTPKPAPKPKPLGGSGLSPEDEEWEKLRIQRFEEREEASRKRGLIALKKHVAEVNRIRAAAEAEYARRIQPMIDAVRAPFAKGTLESEMATIGVDLSKMTLDIDEQLMRSVRWDNIQAAFRDGVRTSVTDGIRAGLEAALMTGDIGNFTKALAQTLSGSLAKAMTDYLMSGMKEIWTRFGKTIIEGLSNVMAEFAAKSIVFAKMMEAIKKFLAFGNGVGALIAATALLAFAHANGGKASMGSTTIAGGAGGLSTGMMPSTLPTQQIIFGATSATTAAGMQPRQAMNVTVIGPNDPSAQRAIQELMTKANSRGRIG